MAFRRYPPFQVTPDRNAVLPAAGAPPVPTYTITVDAGSYLITGFRATLRYSGAPVTGGFAQVINIAVMGVG
jgi:hypothetical protein